mgnify:CR=1 FL=1
MSWFPPIIWLKRLWIKGASHLPGILAGYLDAEALPNSLELIPPPPVEGSAAFALDQEVSQKVLPLRDTPRWNLAIEDANLDFPEALDAFSCTLGIPITKKDTFPVLAAQSRGGAGDVSKTYRTKTGKTIVVSQSLRTGRSLATIEVRTEGFEHDFGEVFEDRNPISNVFVADLDGNGFDEIYIVTRAAGSGSYGSILGFASKKDKSLSMIHLPEIR